MVVASPSTSGRPISRKRSRSENTKNNPKRARLLSPIEEVFTEEPNELQGHNGKAEPGDRAVENRIPASREPRAGRGRGRSRGRGRGRVRENNMRKPGPAANLTAATSQPRASSATGFSQGGAKAQQVKAGSEDAPARVPSLPSPPAPSDHAVKRSNSPPAPVEVTATTAINTSELQTLPGATQTGNQDVPSVSTPRLNIPDKSSAEGDDHRSQPTRGQTKGRPQASKVPSTFLNKEEDLDSDRTGLLFRSSDGKTMRFTEDEEILQPMCQNPLYAPYLFELAIWNILDKTFFARNSVTWAYENFNHETHTFSESGGLARVINNLTRVWGTSTKDETKLYSKRLRFFEWRKNAVDFVFETLISHASCEQMANESIFHILWTWLDALKPTFMTGDATAWDTLVLRTTRLVTTAANLAVKMRRSPDGVWSPFIPTAGSRAAEGAVRVHARTEVALPPEQDSLQPGSMVVLTVVPGLSKYTVRRCEKDQTFSVVRRRIRRRARCFVDLGLSQVQASSA
ncbi:hypothetical protein M406DRAFT_328273 [Cryphonectria parasitica EP155]|uniref:Uncharacterized protein n=1 Tax=Cryphonectria parasitica (strain ATCC 38755 / EP155) TaxID=660469 RepID=A0A9P5CQF7_CRYP1|nr:uncharacterized protein M406DRAFT_328273 [Cryphonectria parasitica EP155]KAF3767178.1 hypothetical protein M406DRAFT_328273 [Cryphonectria parasitica EP155]